MLIPWQAHSAKVFFRRAKVLKHTLNKWCDMMNHHIKNTIFFSILTHTITSTYLFAVACASGSSPCSKPDGPSPA